ncbi:alpha/beta fold hydrolase [Ottowia sp.]|uniref:YheT family hydrolase n=1 Tax=Ottowia sp. TaxID=1898956 RepID=UPI002C8EB659|nr:alpha/beta fold hydrolase [Ottowia sp.]HOB66089.1 alpha/beta fold hydrolase [Ottowia sp.]HPZ57801.1 alpha/beta fold hydrolase [Ottowia sp.]HQD48032.1 alpha/beta fold hydrolase [Ottowia sp.]
MNFELPAYRAPVWLPGGHGQTIWPALYARRFVGPRPRWRRERWDTPDGDFIDVDWLHADAPPAAGGAGAIRAAPPLLVLFHGLEGSSRSHYAEAFAGWARAHGLALAVPHFRGCSGEINRAPRAYHSGDHAEIGWLLRRFRAAQAARGGGPLLAVGISLGGNALLRWAGEWGQAARPVVDAIAAVCAPLDLAAGGHAIGRGFNRQVYNRVFLRTMKAKARAKLAQHPGLFDAAALRAARDLYAFDDLFTAPLHGFAGVLDYWRRASAKPLLPAIRVPALALNARNDPFVPAASLPCRDEVGRWVTLWQPDEGGHVGFAQGALPGHVMWLPQAVGGWLLAPHSELPTH